MLVIISTSPQSVTNPGALIVNRIPYEERAHSCCRIIFGLAPDNGETK